MQKVDKKLAATHFMELCRLSDLIFDSVYVSTHELEKYRKLMMQYVALERWLQQYFGEQYEPGISSDHIR